MGRRLDPDPARPQADHRTRLEITLKVQVLPRFGSTPLVRTLTRYGSLFEDGSEAAVDRLDTLLGGGSKDSDNVLQMDTRKLR